MMNRSTPKTTIALAGSLLLALALGCQTPVVPATPRAIVSLGSLQWTQAADLAIMLDFRPLLAKRKVQATTTVGPVATIEAKVTGENIVGEILAPVIEAANCISGIATISFEHLPAGRVHVVVNAYDANHHLISYGKGDADIAVGETKTINVTCQPADSGLIVNFDCPEACNATPTPLPSATSSPTPTPHPPANPTIPNLTGWVQGLIVDDVGNIYLISTDPGVNPTQPMGRFAGRVVKVPADLSSNGNVLAATDNLNGSSIDGVFQGGNVIVGTEDQDFSPATITGVYDVNTGARVSYIPDFFGPTIFAINSQNKVESTFQWNAGNWVGFQQMDPIQALYANNEDILTAPNNPFALVLDEQDHPIFGSVNKIYLVPDLGPGFDQVHPAFMNNQQVLATLPTSFGTNRIFGFEKTPNSSKFLFSLTGNSNIYLWDRNDPTNFTNVAGTLDGEFPHQIKRSANGQYFVLSSKVDLTSAAMDQYRVYRFDLDNGTLVNKTLMVSTYN